jgi:hypothetical protein
MGLQDAGSHAVLDRYIGYFGPYASSHQALDHDLAMQEELHILVQLARGLPSRF